MDTKEKRWSRMNWDIGIDISTVLCIKEATNENRLYSTGSSTQCRGDLSGMVIQEGTYVYVWLIPFAVQQKLVTAV